MSKLPISSFINRLGIGMIKWTIICSVSQLSILREMILCEFLKIMRQYLTDGVRISQSYASLYLFYFIVFFMLTEK